MAPNLRKEDNPSVTVTLPTENEEMTAAFSNNLIKPEPAPPTPRIKGTISIEQPIPDPIVFNQ